MASDEAYSLLPGVRLWGGVCVLQLGLERWLECLYYHHR